MKFTKIALTLFCSIALFCGCAKDSDIVLKINDKNITRQEFYGDFNRIKNLQLKNAPKELQKDDSYAVIALKERFLNDVIVRSLLEQEFEKRKIEASEKEIKDKKAQIIAQIGSEEQFNNILKQNQISEQRLNSDMANEVKIAKLIETLGGKEATNSEVEKYYKQNKIQFTMPERVKASHILFDTNPESLKRKITDADKEAKLSTADIDSKVKEEIARKEKLAEEVRQKALKNPKNFAELAKQYSEDPGSAQKGGDLGFVTRTQVVKEFGDVAFSQKVGTISPIVKSQFGEHIIYVTDKAAAGVQPLSAVKNDLKTYLTEQKKIQTLQKLIDGLKQSAKIEYVDTSLSPDNIKKQLEEALPKQIEFQKKQGAPKSKQKVLDKIKKEKEAEK